MARSLNDATSGATVTVGCKLPHGLVLRVFDMVEKTEHVMGGGSRVVKEAMERPERVTLNGWSHPQNMAPRSEIVHGFALTPNVPKEFWDRWHDQNKDSDVVRNGLIFAHQNHADAQAESRDKREFRSGLERLDPNKLPNGLTKADTQKQPA